MRLKGKNEKALRRELSRATPYSKLEKGTVSVLQRNSRARVVSGLCWESRDQSARQGGPEQQRQGLQFVLSAVESHLRGFVFVC